MEQEEKPKMYILCHKDVEQYHKQVMQLGLNPAVHSSVPTTE
jgi:hypothetical protein